MKQTRPIDPSITEATVAGGKTVKIDSRVKHFHERFTGNATATVIGFYYDPNYSVQNWIKVVVKPDNPNNSYGTAWDWDRTELVADD